MVEAAVEAAVENAGFTEVDRLKRGLRVLQVVIAVAPLLGLVGTVYGMIGSFQSVELAEAGVGVALRSTWDIGPELREGKLKIVLPQYRASKDVGLHAVYPSRRFLPAKVRVFIDFLAGLYGPSPYWDAGLDASFFIGPIG